MILLTNLVYLPPKLVIIPILNNKIYQYELHFKKFNYLKSKGTKKHFSVFAQIQKQKCLCVTNTFILSDGSKP